MSKIVKQTEEQLKDLIISAVNTAINRGELDSAGLPQFIIEKPSDKKNGDFSTNIAMALSTFSFQKNTIQK